MGISLFCITKSVIVAKRKNGVEFASSEYVENNLHDMEDKLFKGFAKGYYDPEHGGTIIMYADELYKNNRPHVEFCHFCILRNLLVPVSKEILELNLEMTENDMMFDVEWVFILKSDDKEKNK